MTREQNDWTPENPATEAELERAEVEAVGERLYREFITNYWRDRGITLAEGKWPEYVPTEEELEAERAGLETIARLWQAHGIPLPRGLTIEELLPKARDEE